MDDNSKQLINDCFLRPIADPRGTNTQDASVPSRAPLKTELQVLRLTEDSKKMVMDTLRSIHGKDFELNQAKSYKDKGGNFKKFYWEDRGTLMVQSVTNFSSVNYKNNIETSEDRIRRYAIRKLECYGFHPNHCVEAIDYCKGDIETALQLLFAKYMKCDKEIHIDSKSEINETDEEFLRMRNQEKEVLESIYDKLFEEKELNSVWLLKFQIDHLLKYSPSEKKKELTAAIEKLRILQDKPKEKCKFFFKNQQCKFGSRCRFSHDLNENDIRNKSDLKESESGNSFYLEIRFNRDTKYPFEPPLIFLKTDCFDFPKLYLLKICKRLFNEAKQLAVYGTESVYSLSELLNNEDEITKFLKDDEDTFLDPEKSLFYFEIIDNKIVEEKKLPFTLPSHHKKGTTGKDFRKIDPKKEDEDNKYLVKKFLEKQGNIQHDLMLKLRQKLPAWSKMSEILDILKYSQVIVISGETGCGKSTQVPQFILDNWLCDGAKDGIFKRLEIICTQPRRLSAIGVAERVANERNEKVGNTVGYQIRLENKISDLTRLTFCTIGILLRRLMSEENLESISHIIIDEVHERSEESDFLLMALKEILKKRKDLRVILMSATINAHLFSKYYGEIPIVEIPGRTFPVQQFFLEDIIERSQFVLESDSQYCRKIKKKDEDELLNEIEYADIEAMHELPPKNVLDENLKLSALYARYSGYMKTTCKTLYLMDPTKINPELIENVLQYIIEGNHDWPNEGSILVFLPGLAEIQTVFEALSDSSLFGKRAGKFLLIPLHSTLSSEEQLLVFRKAPKGMRKIVLSTNIAETSITIDDCVFVIDYGLMKEKHFDSNKNMESLELVWVSKANVNQRKGRAGRVMPGISIHLFTSHRYENKLLSQPVPEIYRIPLEQLLLRIKTLPAFCDQNAIEVINKLIEPPSMENILSSITRLQEVGAFDNKLELTPLGHHLSLLPVDCKIGKLIIFGAIFQCLDSILTIAACLSYKSPFVSPFNKRYEADNRKKLFSICNSDHLTILNAYKKWNEAAKRSNYAGRSFADENFLSSKTLEVICEIKYQFLELLVSIGFVPIDLPPVHRKNKKYNDNLCELIGNQLNSNGDNNRLLISILCGGLYPNVVKVLTPEKSYQITSTGAMPKELQSSDLRFKTRQDGFVAIHPSSVISTCNSFLSPYLIYQEKVKTSRIFIKDCSMVPLIPLVFFSGSDMRIELQAGDFVILLENGWIILKAHTHEIAEMIHCLRQELFQLLEEKIRDPCLNLLNHENGKKIISTIVYLVSRD